VLGPNAVLGQKARGSFVPGPGELIRSGGKAIVITMVFTHPMR
jgi:hypothetical protein